MRWLLLAVLLVSCTPVDTDGPDAQGYTWRKDGPSGTPVIHRNVDVFLHCGLEPNAKACSIQAGDGTCQVFLPKNAESWMEAHELKHCDGWTHPNGLKGKLH